MIFEGVNDIGTAGLDAASQEMVYQVSVALSHLLEL
jgi:phosphoribosylformylglycinamidine (FGAM) synthase-like enzyme